MRYGIPVLYPLIRVGIRCFLIGLFFRGYTPYTPSATPLTTPLALHLYVLDVVEEIKTTTTTAPTTTYTCCREDNESQITISDYFKSCFNNFKSCLEKKDNI